MPHYEIYEMDRFGSDRVSLLLVEDHVVVRDGLRLVIEQSGRYHVCAEAGSAEEALAKLGEQPQAPAIVMLDLLLGGRESLDLIAKILQQAPATRVLVFTMLQEEVYAERALQAGAAGYLMKSASRELLLTALDQVHAGGTFLSPKAFVRVFRGMHSRQSRPSELDRLSDRELQLFQMIGAGLPNREIAHLLAISVKTVEAHRENIKNKLGLADAGELMAAASRFIAMVRS